MLLSFVEFLMKCYGEKLNQLQRKLDSLKDKINWCLPDSCSDKYNLEMKEKYLEELSTDFEDCQLKLNNLNQSSRLFEQNSLEIYLNEVTEINENFKNLINFHTQTTKDVNSSLHLWNQYETDSINFNEKLKHFEDSFKVQNCELIDINNIDDKLLRVSKLQNEDLLVLKTNFESFENITKSLQNKFPKAHAEQSIDKIKIRYENIVSDLARYSDVMITFKHNYDCYQDQKNQLDNWLRSNQDITYDENALDKLHSLSNDRENIQKIVSLLTDYEERLLSGKLSHNFKFKKLHNYLRRLCEL